MHCLVWTACTALLPSAAFSACAAVASEGTCSGAPSGLYFASSEEDYLGLSGAQAEAIMAIIDERDRVLCSGTLIARDLVLTARHCTTGGQSSLQLAFGQLVDRRERRATANVLAVHPDQDLALLTVASGDLGIMAAVAEPIAVLSPGNSSLQGRSATAVGFGRTERGESGARAYLTDRIINTEPLLTIDGEGESGACNGDSGGPLLVRADDGTIRVAGVLSRGSATCLHKDRYVRLDAMQAWFEEYLSTSDSASARACGTITPAGRCFDELAVWCEHERLQASLCGATTRCVSTEHAGGLRCVPAENLGCPSLGH